MRRPLVSAGLALVQGVVLAVGAWGLHDRSLVDAALLGVAAGAQGVAGTAGVPAPAPPFAPGETLRVTLLADGVARLDPASLTSPGAAPIAALFGRAGPPDAESALVVDVCVGPVPGGLARPGVDAPADRSPVLHVRTARAKSILPGVYLPTVAEGAVRCASAVASVAGVTGLRAGWAPGPAVSPAALDDAVRAGAAHLVHNQHANGRFTYLVHGPSGEDGGGYNYPRHAGTAWYLARVASALGDAEAGAAADRALGDLDTRSRTTTDGRRSILDPARKDGRTWIGTTSLAVLAQLSRADHSEAALARLGPWARQVVASVDDTGMVRSEMLLSDGTFPDQVANAYGQGQAMLALAAFVRAGPPVDPGLIEAARQALERATAYVATGYYGTPHPLYVPDEHWMCLAAHAGAEALGRRAPGPDGVCATYAAQMVWEAPQESALRPPAGPAGGGAEALIARAWDTRDPRLLAAALRFGQLLLDNQYRPADAPLLGDAAALVGGFRDAPGDLDVQIDAVQHIGSALLGVEALLSDRERPGSLP